jgi:uncharacterized protein with NRDE domain
LTTNSAWSGTNRSGLFASCANAGEETSKKEIRHRQRDDMAFLAFTGESSAQIIAVLLDSRGAGFRK